MRKKGSMSKGCLRAKIHNNFEMHENNLSIFWRKSIPSSCYSVVVWTSFIFSLLCQISTQTRLPQQMDHGTSKEKGNTTHVSESHIPLKITANAWLEEWKFFNSLMCPDQSDKWTTSLPGWVKYTTALCCYSALKGKGSTHLISTSKILPVLGFF